VFIGIILPGLDNQIQRLSDMLLGSIMASVQGVPDLVRAFYISQHGLGLSRRALVLESLARQLVLHVGRVGPPVCPPFFLELRVFYILPFESLPSTVIGLGPS
jgi:hypothetical protein